MKLFFTEIRFKNFMSFGNGMQVFTFKPGFTHISGVNGSGKSTLSGEALSFGLFNKPYRKIKIGELVNRVNKKNGVVEIDFTKNGSNFTIIRNIAPAKVKIIQDGVDLNERSSNKLTQEDINAILGIDYDGFRQIVSVSSNNNTPFIALTSAEKRKIIENIFDLQMISEANKLLKQDRYDLKIRLSAEEASLKGLEITLSEMHQHKQKIDSIRNTFNSEKERVILKLTEDKELKVVEINESIQKINNIKEQLAAYDAELLQEQKSRLFGEIYANTSSIGELTGVLKKMSTDVNLLQTTTTCPVCKTDITDEHRNVELTKIKNSVKEDLEQLTILQKAKETLTTEYNSVGDSISALNNIQEQFNAAGRVSGQLLLELDALDKAITQKQSETLPTISDADVEELNNKIKSKITDYATIKKSIDEINLKMSVIDIAERILSDKGIKSEYYTMIVPVLNEKLNEYMKKFEMPIAIMFDDYLDYNIKSISKSTETLNYFSFSEGEKKKIDISIMLSFIYMSKMISNWDCNLLFLDEVLDTGVDSDSLDIITSLVKDVTVSDTSNNSVYVVSHRDINKDVFDYSITIEKEAGFSKITHNN